MEARPNLTALSSRALDQACTFAACCQTRAAPAKLKEELDEWWRKVGQNLLCGEVWAAEEAELSDDENMDEEDQTSGEPAKEDQDKISSAECQDLAASIDSAKQTALIEKELVEMDAMEAEGGDSNPDSVSMSCGDELAAAFPESDEEYEDVVDANVLTADLFTLEDVLVKADLLHFAPDSGEHEGTAQRRVKALIPFAQQVVAACRVHEGLLSKAAVLGCKRPQNKRNLLQHQLAMARLAFQCSAARQSRRSLWQQFSQRVLKDVKQKDEGGEECAGAKAVTKLGPPAQLDSSGNRIFQVLVVRPAFGCASDGLEMWSHQT